MLPLCSAVRLNDCGNCDRHHFIGLCVTLWSLSDPSVFAYVASFEGFVSLSRANTHTRARARTHTHKRPHTHARAHARTHKHTTHTYTRARARKQTHTHARTRTHIHAHAHAYNHARARTHINTHAFIHILNKTQSCPISTDTGKRRQLFYGAMKLDIKN